jgi:hypothetical protein
MTDETATQIVTEFEKSGVLPKGYTADYKSSHTTTDGFEYEVVFLMQDNEAKISYTRKNGQPEEISVVQKD